MSHNIRVLLAASGGGHVRQILDLHGAWVDSDYLIVTEDTALGRSISDTHPVRFVSHYALGQARLGRTNAMLAGALRNLVQSFLIVKNKRPEVVITTGAGAMFWVTVFSKAMGARVILIDSFARFEAPSKFARIVRYIADETVVQSAKLKDCWPNVHVYDPFRIVQEEIPLKQDLVFATVGATLAFPRLVSAMLCLKRSGHLPERVIVQVGAGGRPSEVPEGVEVHEVLSFPEIQKVLHSSKFVVTHGGTGSLITALRAGCRVIAMPRRFTLGEHYDEHQEEISEAFRRRGLIEIADTPEELLDAINSWRERVPTMATTEPAALIQFLKGKLAHWFPRR